MNRWVKNLKDAQQRRALRRLRLDPHLAKDIGLPMPSQDPKIGKILW